MDTPDRKPTPTVSIEHTDSYGPLILIQGTEENEEYIYINPEDIHLLITDLARVSMQEDSNPENEGV